MDDLHATSMFDGGLYDWMFLTSCTVVSRTSPVAAPELFDTITPYAFVSAPPGLGAATIGLSLLL